MSNRIIEASRQENVRQFILVSAAFSSEQIFFVHVYFAVPLEATGNAHLIKHVAKRRNLKAFRLVDILMGSFCFSVVSFPKEHL